MKKGLIFLANDVEDGEALFTRALLIRAGFEIDTATLNLDKRIVTAYGLKVEVDYLLSEINFKKYDFLIVPGGSYVSKQIDKNEELIKLIQDFEGKKKMIGAICAGPQFLAKAGVLKNKSYTAFSDVSKYDNTANYVPKLKAVTDDKVITARGAGVIYEFVYEIIKYYQDETAAKTLLEKIKHI